MQEIFEKIMAMLEKHRAKYENLCADGELEDSRYFQGKIEGMDISQKIAQQAISEYNNGWIPCENGKNLPKSAGNCIGTVKFEDGSKGSYPVWYHDGIRTDILWELDGHPANVIAWQPLPPRYEPKEEKS